MIVGDTKVEEELGQTAGETLAKYPTPSHKS